MNYADTYFFNASEAYKVAKEKNKNNNYHLQVCYYDGEKIESDLVNLIHLPIDNLIDDMALGTFRLPTAVNFDGLDISEDIKSDILNNFNESLKQIVLLRRELNRVYLSNLKKRKLNFEEPLRFYLIANTNTQVMQYVSDAISKTLKKMGCDFFLHKIYGCEDNHSLKEFHDYNPHVCININHFNNEHLNDEIFNFVWFQDFMPILTNNQRIQLRKRDFVFSLIPNIDNLLDKKDIPYQRQDFCFNDDYYKNKSDIKRKNKIVFIGSSYYSQIENTPIDETILSYIEDIYYKGLSFSSDRVSEIVSRFSLNNVSKEFLIQKIIPYVIRDLSIKMLCSIETDYEIEIYGHGWDIYDEVKPFYKGVLKYGNEIADVYNSAKFALISHSMYFMQQRVLESAKCGAIPIVYDLRELTNENSYPEAFEYFKTKDDLSNILKKKDLEKDFGNLLEKHRYERFIEKMLCIIDEKL